MNLFAEWLEADGVGGFASGTVGGERTRRYHALLLAATTPPTGRMVLVNGLEAWVKTPRGRFAISSHRYQPGVVFPDGAQRVESFSIDPWPRWVYRLEDTTRVEQQLFAVHGSPTVAIRWRLVSPAAGPVTLAVRPLLSGRDYHNLHHENPVFRFDPTVTGQQVAWQPYPGVPRIDGLQQRQLLARSGVVSQFHLFSGARARARQYRGSGFAGPVSLGPGPR